MRPPPMPPNSSTMPTSPLFAPRPCAEVDKAESRNSGRRLRPASAATPLRRVARGDRAARGRAE
eukprot:6822417-Pyramimonas_sp.AAC.1